MPTATVLLLALLHQTPTVPPATPSRIADDLHSLTDAIGPRLTGSDAEREAQEWVIARLRDIGLTRVVTEDVPPVDVGEGMQMQPPRWVWRRGVVQQLVPWSTTLVSVPALYSPGTRGAQRGRLRIGPLPRYREEDVTAFIERHRGRLIGTFLLLRDSPARPGTEAVATGIHSSTTLEALGAYDPPPEAPPSPAGADSPRPSANQPRGSTLSQQQRLMTFLRDERVLGLIGAGHGTRGGTITPGVVAAPPGLTVAPPPTVDLTPEHFNRLLAFARRDVAAEIEVDVDASLAPGLPIRNVLADLPGAAHPEELVIVGAHLDSLHGATGATDNAVGVVTLLEAARLLAARPTPLRRTVRFAFWSAEELGLQGSRAYVRQHLLDATGAATVEATRTSAYLNLDYGAGRIRGIYLQGRRPLKPLFDAWLAGSDRDGRLIATLRQALGSDQASFERAGIPGLSFVQDPLEYESRTHHTTMDASDYVAVDDVLASARVLAAIVERIADAPDLLPRGRH